MSGDISVLGVKECQKVVSVKEDPQVKEINWMEKCCPEMKTNYEGGKFAG